MANQTWLHSVPSVDSWKEDIPKIIGYRHANHSDIPRICQLMRTETYDLFGNVEAGKVFEKACVSLVQINEEQEVISNVSLCNFPNVPSVPVHDWLSWMTMHYGLPGVMERNTLFVHLLVWDTRYSETFFKALLSGIFAITSYCLHVIIIVPPGLEAEVNLFEEDMTKTVPKAKIKSNRVQTLYLSLRHRHRPKLKIRRVVKNDIQVNLAPNFAIPEDREEDNDDLIPIIDAESKRLRELYGDFYISEMMRHVEEGTRQLIVAESEGLATGVMCLNSIVNVDLLNENFELAPYNALRKQPSDEPTTSKSTSAASVVNKTASEVLSTENTKDRDKHRFSQAIAQTMRTEYETKEGSDPEGSPEIVVNSPKIGEKRGGLSVNFESRLRESIFAEAIKELPTKSLGSSAYNDEDDDDIRLSQLNEKIERISSSQSYRRESNAFALELFSMDKKIDDRYGQDYLEAAFECFPDLEYCVMLLPTTQPFFPFLENFVRVPLRFDKDFPMVLYVVHRATLFGFLKSREAIAYDREKIETFLQGIPKKKVVLDDFDEAMKSKNREKECYVFFCENKLIGISILCQEVNIQGLRALYNVEEYISLENTARDAHARLLHFILVPIFSVYHRFFFRELMRLSGTTVLYYRLYASETTAPNRTRPLITCLDAMIPVKSRIRIHNPWPKGNKNENQLDDEKFSLFLMTPRFSMMPKPVINAKIVVVGASDCGVAFAECLALEGKVNVYHSSSSSTAHFTNLTLVSSNGLPFEQKGTMKHATMIPFRGRYCFAYRQVVPSRVWINVVHGTVSSINRKDKYVTVWGQGNLSYDYLVLTCGLQYRSLQFRRGNEEAEKRGNQPSKQEINPVNCFCINDDVDAATCLERLKELTTEFTTKKFIVLYGHNIDCYCTLNTLLECGIKGSWITLIQPKLATCENRSHIFYEDEEVDNAIASAIYASGVKVYAEWDLKDWILENGENSVSDNDRSTVIKILRIESKSRKKFLACDALINFGEKSIPMKTFMAISRAGLIFDGRLVINPEYGTNDPHVFAAGAFTKYSRKYHAESWQHEYYNNIEVGERLARSLKRRIDSNNEEEKYHPDVSTSEGHKHTNLPVFRAPKLVYCRLPGSFHYLHVRKPGKNVLRAIAIARGTYGDVLVTGSASADSRFGYFRIRLNQYNQIETITCLSKKAFRVQNLITLYGKHDSMLNNLKIRFQNSLVPDLYAYFAEPWAAALFHDKFDCLRVENRATLLSKTGLNKDSLVDDAVAALIKSEWKALDEKDRQRLESRFAGSVYQDAISSTLINFLEAEEKLLPMYCNPRKLRRQLMDEVD